MRRLGTNKCSFFLPVVDTIFKATHFSLKAYIVMTLKHARYPHSPLRSDLPLESGFSAAICVAVGYCATVVTPQVQWLKIPRYLCLVIDVHDVADSAVERVTERFTILGFLDATCSAVLVVTRTI